MDIELVMVICEGEICSIVGESEMCLSVSSSVKWLLASRSLILAQIYLTEMLGKKEKELIIHQMVEVQ